MEHLSITAVGVKKTRLIEEISSLAAKNKCTIDTARMAIMGPETGLLMLISGNWDGIARLENGLASLQKRKNCEIIHKRVHPKASSSDAMIYTAQIIAINQPGIVDELCRFFVKQETPIVDLHASTYPAPHSNTPMSAINVTVKVPVNINIANLREQFMVLCDVLNVDGIFEPERH